MPSMNPDNWGDKMFDGEKSTVINIVVVAVIIGVVLFGANIIAAIVMAFAGGVE